MDSMNRDPGFIKYSILFLALLHVIVSGHVVCCAHFVSQFVCHFGDHCRHSHHQVPENHQPVCCCPNDHNDEEFSCNVNDQPAVAPQRDGGETENLAPSAVFAPVLRITPLILSGSRGPLTPGSSTAPLRLHLLYRSLLI